MLDFLRAAVAGRMSVIVSGGTGSGKTTFLNVLSEFIGDHERVVTIEDAAELRLRQRHVVRMETRWRTSRARCHQGAAARDQRLRMRPDRIIVGEVRGDEALDMLQAMSTGHDGSMTTIHANSPGMRCIGSTRCGDGELEYSRARHAPADYLRGESHRAANRMSDGTRKVTQISEIAHGGGHHPAAGSLRVRPHRYDVVDV